MTDLTSLTDDELLEQHMAALADDKRSPRYGSVLDRLVATRLELQRRRALRF
jgi:hypothetical protein